MPSRSQNQTYLFCYEQEDAEARQQLSKSITGMPSTMIKMCEINETKHDLYLVMEVIGAWK